LVGIANHRILDDFAAYDRSRRGMISAELATEAWIGHVRIGQDEINSVAVAADARR
jgi:hypothetical protein